MLSKIIVLCINIHIYSPFFLLSHVNLITRRKLLSYFCLPIYIFTQVNAICNRVFLFLYAILFNVKYVHGEPLFSKVSRLLPSDLFVRLKTGYRFMFSLIIIVLQSAYIVLTILLLISWKCISQTLSTTSSEWNVTKPKPVDKKQNNKVSIIIIDDDNNNIDDVLS